MKERRKEGKAKNCGVGLKKGDEVLGGNGGREGGARATNGFVWVLYVLVIYM